MKTKKTLLFLFLIVVTGLVQSCQSFSDGRMLKKFISRFNEEEYASAAAYVYPDDRMNVAFFANEVKNLAPHTFIKLEDYETKEKGENRYIVAKIKWENTTSALLNYFNNIGHPLNTNGEQTVELKIRETNDGETISFPWGIQNVLSENLSIAHKRAKEDSTNRESIQLYASPSFESTMIEATTRDLIVGKADNNGWIPAYTVTTNGDPVTCYFPYDTQIYRDNTAFFHLGIFDSIGVVLALVIIIAILAPFFLLRGVIEAIFSSSMSGPIIVLGLVLAALYVIYQLLEQILFELFIINLPY